jgi:hypothetical protein
MFPCQVGQGSANQTASDVMSKDALNLPNRRRVGPRHMSLYVDVPVQNEIKKLAIEHDCKPHDVLIAALDMLFKKAGRPSVRELTGIRELMAIEK